MHACGRDFTGVTPCVTGLRLAAASPRTPPSITFDQQSTAIADHRESNGGYSRYLTNTTSFRFSL